MIDVQGNAGPNAQLLVLDVAVDPAESIDVTNYGCTSARHAVDILATTPCATIPVDDQTAERRTPPAAIYVTTRLVGVVIDAVTNAVTATIHPGNLLTGAAVVPAAGTVYVTRAAMATMARCR